MRVWTLAFLISCLTKRPIGVFAQEAWSDIGNGDDPEDFEIGENWAGPNALSRSTMFDRQERLQYKCDQMTKDNPLEKIQDPEAFRNLLVDDKHKLLYCYVPKVIFH